MIRIYCSKKLADYIGDVNKTLPIDNSDCNPKDWNAHIFTLERKKHILLVHTLTHYSIFIDRITKKSFKQFDNLFKESLELQLANDGLLDESEHLDKLFFNDRHEFFKSNNNRRALGRINYNIETFKFHCSYKYDSFENMPIAFENRIINTTPIELLKNGKMVWTDSIEEMKKLLKTST